MCGHAGVCPCKHEVVSGEGGAVSKAMRNRSREEIEESNKKREETFLNDYGVRNARQIKNNGDQSHGNS